MYDNDNKNILQRLLERLADFIAWMRTICDAAVIGFEVFVVMIVAIFVCGKIMGWLF